MFVKEWPIGLFKKFYPDYMNDLASIGIDADDHDYIVRVEYLEDGTVNRYEVGYASDKWCLKV